MPPKLKTIFFWLLAIFLVYAVVTNPERAAGLLRGIWDLIAGLLAGFGQFFESLTS